MTKRRSESGLEHREYTCDTRVSFSLLSDSNDDGASEWYALPKLLQVLEVIGRLIRKGAVEGSKRRPRPRSTADDVFLYAPQFCGSSSWVQYGIDIEREAIVARVMKEESHRRLGLSMILLEGQPQFVGEVHIPWGL